MSLILQNLNGRSVLENSFLKMILLVGSQTVLILHIVALLAKNDFSPDITSWHPYKTFELVLQFWKSLPRPFLATPISLYGQNSNFWQEGRRDLIF